MRKVRIVYTCSDFKSHEHRYQWSAWLCGRVQFWRDEMLALLALCIIILVYGLFEKLL